eukprot:s1983_g7.t1
MAPVVGSSGKPSPVALSAAFGRRPKLGLSRPKLEINDLDDDTSPSNAKPEPRRIGERRDALDVELQRLAQAVLPRPSDQRSKAKVLTDLEDVATAALGTKATVYPFGSSANGCGERLSDIDAVLDIVDGFDASDAGFVLSAIEEACEEYGFTAARRHRA